MRKLFSFMHISLDGFVAGPNGEMDWIKVDQEIFDFVENRISAGDTAMYGRKTFEMMEAYWPTAAVQPNASKHDRVHSKWYMNAHKIVLSKSMKSTTAKNAKIISENLVENIKAIKQEQGPEILLFGSPTATHSLHQLNMIDGYWLFLNPVILGTGIPLFKNIQNKTTLKLLSTHQFSNGVVELNYLNT